jgi:hypothetical protein
LGLGPQQKLAYAGKGKGERGKEERREKRGKGKGERGAEERGLREEEERKRERERGGGGFDGGNVIGKNENIFSENNIFHSLLFSLFIVTSAAARSSSHELNLFPPPSSEFPSLSPFGHPSSKPPLPRS